jgi:hypothetical protein
MPDHLTTAQGYAELGMFLEANAELDEIQPDHRDAADVLALRVQIYGALEKWELMQTVARRLAVVEPENVQWTVSWAYATRRAESIEAARVILLNAVEALPNAAIRLEGLHAAFARS